MSRPYAERTAVLALLAEVGRGAITVEEVASRLQELLVPAAIRVSPAGDAMALMEAAYDDSVPPRTGNSWDDVERATSHTARSPPSSTTRWPPWW